MSEKRLLNANDLFLLNSVSDPRVSPNEQEVLLVNTHMDEKENKYVSNLYHYQLNTNELNQWTFGKHRVSQPRWSNDGEKLLFLSNKTDKNQVYMMSRNGGEAKQVTDEKDGVSNAHFSPDGKKIIFQVKHNVDDSNEKEDDKEKLPKPVVINRMKYKADGAGLLKESYQHIKIVDLETEEIQMVKEGRQNYFIQTWINDQSFIYTTDEDVNQDFNFNHNVYIHDVKNNTDQEIETEDGYASSFSVSPNGKQILFVHMGRQFENATHAELMHYNLDTGVLTCMTESLDAPVGDYVVADSQQQTVLQGAAWASDHDFYFPLSIQGNVLLYYGNLGGELYPAVNGSLHIHGFDLINSKQQAVLTVSTPTNPSELYLLDLTNGNLTSLTSFNEVLLNDVKLVEPQPITYKGKDDWTVHGWFMKPANYEEGQSYPMILNIHGGPHAFYANTFFHEMQYLAANGYAVLYVNPRGSHSYGQKFVDAVRGDYGNGDYQDLMKAVDYVLNEFNWIDDSRLGVTGGSYGGFMTNWIVGHTERFKAAVTQRSISNWISFRGVSDIGYYFNEWQIQADLDNLEKLWKHSPIAYVDQVKTPLKIIHNEHDYRCPIEQAEQLFIALKHRGIETEFVRFPESDHNLSRTGKPNLRIERLQHILNWFDDYLN